MGILRAIPANKHEWASRYNRKLCANDIVIVPKSLPRLTIRYYSEDSRKETLMAGDRYQVVALVDEGMWSKLVATVSSWYEKWTSTEPLQTSPDKGTGWRGNQAKPRYIFTPLAAGEGSDYPFYLLARQGTIPLFWYGGKPPYRVIVTNAANQVIVQNTTQTAAFSFILPNTEPGSEYSLTIQSTADKSCRSDNSKLCQKQLIFAVPPFPVDQKLDPEILSATLLANCDKNWRLEIWRQLTAMPASQKKQRFMARLDADDIDLDDTGLCQ